mmetsp:Transcript_12409/g.19409  ORF Transcript_12409/g.19409 Transcript_12409/m.19409 type:complete len:139 (+) Transcript_12409:1362-1778(+)
MNKGISYEKYMLFGKAVSMMIDDKLGGQIGPSIKKAWSEVYDAIASAMLREHFCAGYEGSEEILGDVSIQQNVTIEQPEEKKTMEHEDPSFHSDQVAHPNRDLHSITPPLDPSEEQKQDVSSSPEKGEPGTSVEKGYS